MCIRDRVSIVVATKIFYIQPSPDTVTITFLILNVMSVILMTVQECQMISKSNERIRLSNDKQIIKHNCTSYQAVVSGLIALTLSAQ